MRARDFFRSGRAFLLARFGGCVPLKVSHHLTYSCNLSCKFCGRSSVSVGELSTRDVKLMMKEFSDAGTVFWSFNGGEPLVREDIGELVSYGTDLGLSCFLVTNGVLLKKKFNDISNISGVELSLEGPKSFHDGLCGVGVYEKAVEGLSLLRDANVPVLIKMVLTKQTIPDIEHVLTLSERYGVQVNVQPVAVHKEDAEKKATSFFPKNEDFKKLIDWLILQKKSRRPVASSKEYLTLLGERWPKKNDIPCSAGKLYCNVTPQGYVTACCNRLNETESNCFGPKLGYRKAFLNLPDYQNCYDCFYSTPMEFNILVNSAPKKSLSILKNLINKKTTWS